MTKSFRGVFYSPFIRAYPPDFAAEGISHDAFIRFIDGLNEAFLASPIFQATNAIGSGMGIAPYHPVAWAGLGLQVVSGLASAGVSYTRARAFIQQANASLFAPVGYHAAVLNTKKMMAKVGLEGDQLSLPDRNIPALRVQTGSASRSAFAPIPDTNEELLTAYAARYHNSQPEKPLEFGRPALDAPHPQSLSRTQDASAFPVTNLGADHAAQPASSGQPDRLQMQPQLQMQMQALCVQQWQPVSAIPATEEYLQMPDLNRLGITNQENEEDDPRLRRLKALEGYVRPLEIETLPPELPDSWFKRMGVKRSEKLGKKQEAKMRKKQAKSDKKVAKDDPKLRIQRIQDKWQRKQGKAQRKLMKDKATKNHAKVLQDLKEDMQKMNQKIDKAHAELQKRDRKNGDSKPISKADKNQQKIANKIRWVVISPIGSRARHSEDDVPVSDDERSFSEHGSGSEDSDSSLSDYKEPPPSYATIEQQNFGAVEQAGKAYKN